MSNHSHTVSIVGAGWLGLPLAIRLNSFFTTLVSCSTEKKVSALKKQGLNARCMTVSESGNISANFDSDAFFLSDIVIITLPFRRYFSDPRCYEYQMEAILSRISLTSKIVFTSSTSVYPDDSGYISESDHFYPKTLRQFTLKAVEEKVISREGIVLRLAGLYGPNREIGRFFSHRKLHRHPDSPVNLIHLDDVIGIIVGLIQKNLSSSIYNLVSDFHPTRQELYSYYAKKYGGCAPEFSLSAPIGNKIISNTRIKDMLGYMFIYPNPMED